MTMKPDNLEDILTNEDIEELKENSTALLDLMHIKTRWEQLLQLRKEFSDEFRL